MDLLPAIDLRGGRVVRLVRGDDALRTEYGDDPLAVARRFAEAGARRLHVVDLDAALGEPPQRPLVARLAAAMEEAGVAVQTGGGLRDERSIAAALDAGCERAVVGSLVARDPAAFAALARAFPDRLVPALDVAGGTVRVAGWRDAAPTPLEELARGLAALPCPALLVTDVERDGTLGGPNLELTARVAGWSGLPALVSGGVRSLDDLAAARATPGVGGVVVGKAIYEGRFGVEAALAVAAGERS